ncbi:MAG: hypothetical protein ABSB28_01885 [Candidatus Bathyarchaeia archaeon]
MALNTKTKRSLAVGFAILAFSSILVNLVATRAAPSGGVNLPSTIVRIEVINGTATYFNITLSEVPMGYDVANGTYPGWCVDQTAIMARSPVTHEVRLYSSLNPPGTLATQRWDMVNYILNHKQGTLDDIQQAIWNFVNGIGNYTPSSTVAKAIVNDALANGNGFIPESNQTIAVICLPVVLSPDVQVSIIEAVALTSSVHAATVIIEPERVAVHDPDTLNLKGRGTWVNCSITLPEGYNASDIDASTLLLNGTVTADLGSVSVQDSQLMAKFNRTLVSRLILSKGIMFGNVTLTVTAQLYNGTIFEGNDTIGVEMPGDVTMDGKVDIYDAIAAATAFGSYPGHPEWNSAADENDDGTVNIFDVIIIAGNFGKTYA